MAVGKETVELSGLLLEVKLHLCAVQFESEVEIKHDD